MNDLLHTLQQARQALEAAERLIAAPAMPVRDLEGNRRVAIPEAAYIELQQALNVLRTQPCTTNS